MLLYICGSVQFGTITISTVSHSKWKIVFRATFLIFMYFKHLLCTCMKLNAKKAPMSKTTFLFTINAKSISNTHIEVKDLHKHDINWIEHGMGEKNLTKEFYTILPKNWENADEWKYLWHTPTWLQIAYHLTW